MKQRLGETGKAVNNKIGVFLTDWLCVINFKDQTFEFN